MRIFLTIIGIFIALEIGVRIIETLVYEDRVGVLTDLLEFRASYVLTLTHTG